MRKHKDASSERFSGTVSKFEKSWGFITYWDELTQRAREIFVHWSDIDMDGYKTLTPGQSVEFSIGYNDQGKTKAVDVREA